MNFEILKIDNIGIYKRLKIVGVILSNYRDHYSDKGVFDEAFIFYLIRKICKTCPLIEHLSLVLASSEKIFVEFEKSLKIFFKN